MKRKRVAVLLSFEAIKSLLRLRNGLNVTAAKVHDSEQMMEFFITGDELEEIARCTPTPRTALSELVDWELR